MTETRGFDAGNGPAWHSSEVRPGSPLPPEISREQIERRAYEIYVGSGCPQGQSKEHWLQAESELLELAAASARRERSASAPAEVRPAVAMPSETAVSDVVTAPPVGRRGKGSSHGGVNYGRERRS